jgi:hypothetical protein
MIIVTMGNDENAVAHYLISISVLVPTYCAATAAGTGRRRWNSKGFAEDDGALFILPPKLQISLIITPSMQVV